MRFDLLIRRALRNAPPAEAERIRKALREGRVAEALPELVKLAEREGPPDIYYVSGSRFEAVEGREEVVGEVEEAVTEDGLEPVGEVEEVVEDDEYLGQRVARRVFPDPEERPRARRLPYRSCLRPLNGRVVKPQDGPIRNLDGRRQSSKQRKDLASSSREV